MFTKAAVQRAMDAKAKQWGAPPGYYTVEDRALILNDANQIWMVKVRLFGGSVLHIEDILFSKLGGLPNGNIIYTSKAAPIMTPEMEARRGSHQHRYASRAEREAKRAERAAAATRSAVDKIKAAKGPQ